jgi:hypothetical protein
VPRRELYQADSEMELAYRVYLRLNSDFMSLGLHARGWAALAPRIGSGGSGRPGKVSATELERTLPISTLRNSRPELRRPSAAATVCERSPFRTRADSSSPQSHIPSGRSGTVPLNSPHGFSEIRRPCYLKPSGRRHPMMVGVRAAPGTPSGGSGHDEYSLRIRAFVRIL